MIAYEDRLIGQMRLLPDISALLKQTSSACSERDWELVQAALSRGMKETLRQIWPEVLDGDSADLVRF